jgi:hypothetical protein
MRTRKPVQINFIQVLAIASIGTFSLNAFGDHQVDQKASKAATMSKPIEERGIAGEAERESSADELKIKMDDEKDRAQMREMMARDPNKKPEAK